MKTVREEFEEIAKKDVHLDLDYCVYNEKRNHYELIEKYSNDLYQEDIDRVEVAYRYYTTAQAKHEAEIGELVEALYYLTDDDPCQKDHHGYCQTHWSGDAEICNNEVAQKILAKYKKTSVPCKKCGGSGKALVETRFINGERIEVYEACTACQKKEESLDDNQPLKRA